MNINPYLYLFGGLSLVSPLVFAFFSLDFDNWTAFWITFSIYSILYTLGVLMFNYLQTGHALKFEPGRKWELIREGQRTIETRINYAWGDVRERECIADVYRKKMRNGTYKYKTVPRN
jgi:hypothetical protein